MPKDVLNAFVENLDLGLISLGESLRDIWLIVQLNSLTRPQLIEATKEIISWLL